MGDSLESVERDTGELMLEPRVTDIDIPLSPDSDAPENCQRDEKLLQFLDSGVLDINQKEAAKPVCSTIRESSQEAEKEDDAPQAPAVPGDVDVEFLVNTLMTFGVQLQALEQRQKQEERSRQVDAASVLGNLDNLESLCSDTTAMGMQHAQTVLGMGVRIEVLEKQVARLLVLLDNKDKNNDCSTRTSPSERSTAGGSTTCAYPNTPGFSESGKFSISGDDALAATSGSSGTSLGLSEFSNSIITAYGDLQQRYAEIALKVFRKTSAIETRMTKMEESMVSEVRRALCDFGISQKSKNEAPEPHSGVLDTDSAQTKMNESATHLTQIGPVTTPPLATGIVRHESPVSKTSPIRALPPQHGCTQPSVATSVFRTGVVQLQPQAPMNVLGSASPDQSTFPGMSVCAAVQHLELTAQVEKLKKRMQQIEVLLPQAPSRTILTPAQLSRPPSPVPPGTPMMSQQVSRHSSISVLPPADTLLVTNECQASSLNASISVLSPQQSFTPTPGTGTPFRTGVIQLQSQQNSEGPDIVPQVERLKQRVRQVEELLQQSPTSPKIRHLPRLSQDSSSPGPASRHASPSRELGQASTSREFMSASRQASPSRDLVQHPSSSAPSLRQCSPPPKVVGNSLQSSVTSARQSSSPSRAMPTPQLTRQSCSPSRDMQNPPLTRRNLRRNAAQSRASSPKRSGLAANSGTHPEGVDTPSRQGAAPSAQVKRLPSQPGSPSTTRHHSPARNAHSMQVSPPTTRHHSPARNSLHDSPANTRHHSPARTSPAQSFRPVETSPTIVTGKIIQQCIAQPVLAGRSALNPLPASGCRSRLPPEYIPHSRSPTS